jgi:2-polyprenyl-3-methyl-5-hydroxy-6-metoxy-1,4-benzoquinol methylase
MEAMPSGSEKYGWKEIPGSSHEIVRRRIRSLPPGLRLLDLGAAGGHLGRAVRDRCSYLAGVEPDKNLSNSAREGYDDWRAVDALNAGDWETPFDVVVCADVLEHLVQPETLLDRVRWWLKPGGLLLASLPNIANISVRLALLFGHFRYTERGILDRTHLSFYTRASATQLLETNGYAIRAIEPTAIPYELAVPALGRKPWNTGVRTLAQLSSRGWPTLFGYQFIFEAERR